MACKMLRNVSHDSRRIRRGRCCVGVMVEVRSTSKHMHTEANLNKAGKCESFVRMRRECATYVFLLRESSWWI
jgi:hypothetical protein